MANPTIETKFGPPDPNAAPLNIVQLVALLNTIVSTTITSGEFLNTVIQSGTPGVGDQDKGWIELDTAGRPKALKVYYAGKWRRVYNGMIGEIRGFSGDPGFGPLPKNFDVNGKGNAEGEYDGWQICNGKNGSQDLSDKFVIGAHMNDTNSHSGWNNGWQTFVDGKADLKSGGTKGTLIQEKNLPPLDNSVAGQDTGLYIHGKEAKESDAHTEIRPLVDVHYANLIPHDSLLIKYGSDPTGTPAVPQEEFPSLPPFYVMAWIQFVGYA